jgi:hypothetical protein
VVGNQADESRGTHERARVLEAGLQSAAVGIGGHPRAQCRRPHLRIGMAEQTIGDGDEVLAPRLLEEAQGAQHDRR